MNRCLLNLTLAMLLLCFAGEAQAHLVSTRFGDFYTGILHPLTSLVHLLAWIGIGLLMGLQPTAASRWVVLIFPGGVLAGLVLARVIGFELDMWMNLASIIVLGALIMLSLGLPRGVLFALAFVVGLSHGYANAPFDAFAVQSFALYAFGVTLVAYALVTMLGGAVRGLSLHADWGSVAVRALGSWLAAVGLVYLGYNLWALPPATLASG